MSQERVTVEETARAAEIKDQEGTLKWTVCMFRGQPTLTDDISAEYFNISVFNGNFEPKCGMSDLSSLDDANCWFDRYVNNYRILVQAESTPIDDIQVYADKIEYTTISPDCCYNCKFCAKADASGKHPPCGNPDGGYYLVCTNQENFSIYDNVFKRRPYRPFPPGSACDYWGGEYHHVHDHDHCGFVGYEHENPTIDYIRDNYLLRNHFVHQLEVYPMVDFNGVCKNYERR